MLAYLGGELAAHQCRDVGGDGFLKALQVVAAFQHRDHATAGGLVGKITKVGDTYVTLEIARGGGDAVEVNVQKSAVTTLLPNGTIKAI